MSLFEVKAEIPFADVEILEARLWEQEDAQWHLWQEVILRRAWVQGVFAGEAEALAGRAALVRWLAMGAGASDGTGEGEGGGVAYVVAVEPLGAVEVRELPEQDWRDSYKAHFKAWQCGRLHWVPVWERDQHVVGAGEAVIWLDPGLAFGTGNHETTRLCCERLVALAETAGAAVVATQRVLDAGCGSGILALSAARLGYGVVAGFDNDAEAVRVSRENAALNGLAAAVEFYAGDLVSGLAGGRQAEVVLANIQADVLKRFAAELLAAVAPGGTLVLSGILAGERAEVQAVFVALAPAWTVETRTLGEWSDLSLRRV